MSLEKAKKLYQQEKYYDCTQECINTIKNNEDLREANLLAAKSFLLLLKHPVDDSSFNTLCDTIKRAIMNCKNMQEVYEVKYEIEHVANEWKPKYILGALEQLENNPCLEQFKVYLNCKLPPARLAVMLSMVTIHPNQKELSAQEGLTPDEASKKYCKEPDNKFSDEDIQRAEFNAAQRIFSAVQDYVSNNFNCTSDTAPTISKTASNALLMLDILLPDKIKENTEESQQPEYLKFHAEILTYLMNSTLYCNTHPISLYMGDRQQTYNKISSLYTQIRQIDSSFQAPVMPNVEAIQPPASSGCYVATAVYGSYDCPEVWTLRRYRDDHLANSWYGRAFIRTYYAVSPTLVKWFGHTEWFKNMWKGKLDRFVEKLQCDGYESSPYQDKHY